MEWVRNRAASREFERFAAEASDPLLRTGFLMTGNAKDAEDLVQETLLRVARRWHPEPSTADMTAKLRRVIIAAKFKPLRPDQPKPEEIHAIRLAWEDAEDLAA